MPVIVASSHHRAGFDEWRRVVEATTRNAAGLASLYVLDPLATELFKTEIGEAYAVWGGAVRTYLPDVAPASAEDAGRHRVLSSSRIEHDRGRAAALLAGLPRQLSAEGYLPRPLAGLSRALVAGDLQGKADSTSRTDARETERLRTEIGQLRANLTAALDLITESERTEDLLAQRNDELRTLAVEFSAVNQRAEFLGDQVRSLQRRLVQIGREAEAYVPADEQTILPTSFAELLDNIKTTPRVDFTGDVDRALELDNRPSASSWAQTAWQTVLAMNDYAEASVAGRFSGSFIAWCKNPPPGERAISAGKVAPDESDSVKHDPRMRSARLFPVPSEIDPTGKAFMAAHVRLGGGGGMSAPRMHYFDCVKRTGRVYVGYLGTHLPVKSTN